ncbi:hypothetical protein QN277_023957 [Acacia crassicarpa]|uniref:Remorin C-terminal domain-containing protein n=1 Tax=Acacia crassicarpa TaxID=499986 RepID=A0AAE1JFL0_9FABA|nr:hypothetical protein QN277_023957 [Acacia crassicarpa]
MNPSHHEYFQASSFSSSSQMESPLPGNTSLFMKNAEPIPDPLCKLHLRETSEFVKSFPMSHNNRGSLEVVSQTKARVEAPSTTGRPIFGLRKSNFSSKWDDAEKWVIGSHGSSTASASSKISTSCDNVFKVSNTPEDFLEKSRSTQEKVFIAVPSFQLSPATLDHHEFTSPPDMVLKDKYTEEKGSKFPNFRDIGTEMTPLGSSTTSRCHTPLKSLSPARHNTPANRSASLTDIKELIQLNECHFAKLQLGTKFGSIGSYWSSRQEEEEEASKSLRHHAYQTQKDDSDSIRSAAWEEEQKGKSCLRYQIEEAKIRAWVSLQRAKAEAESKKLEVKIQKMRLKQEEKLMKRMAVVKRKAEEWSEAAREQHMVEKANEESNQKLLKNSFSSYATSCACFSYTNMME